MVEEDIETLDELARNRNVTAVSADEITKAIKSINKGKSADFVVSQLSIPSSQEVKWRNFLSCLSTVFSNVGKYLKFENGPTIASVQK